MEVAQFREVVLFQVLLLLSLHFTPVSHQLYIARIENKSNYPRLLIFFFSLGKDKRENNSNNFVLLLVSHSLSFPLSLSLSVFAGPVHLPDIWGVQHRGKSALCLKAVGVNERNDKFLMGSLLKSCVGGV